MRRSFSEGWSRSPIGYRQGSLSSGEISALAAVVALGVPAVVIGSELTAAEGIALNGGQLLLAAPLGMVLAGFLLTSGAWMSASLGVPGARVARPALGSWGGVILGLIHLVALLGWGSTALAMASDWMRLALARMGVELPEWVPVAVVVTFGTGLALVGPAWASRVWALRFAFWFQATLLVAALVGGLEQAGGGLVGRQPGPAFWLGVDSLLVLALLWWPFALDSARFSVDERNAVSGIGLGFAVPGLIAVLAAGLLGLPGASLLDTLVGSLLWGGLFLGWAMLAGTNTAMGHLYPMGMALVGPTERLLARHVVPLTAALMFAGAVAGGALSRQIGDLAVAVLAPMVAVILADFYWVRDRSYQEDELYGRRGIYAPLSWAGWLAVVVGAVVGLWLHPVGPEGLASVLATLPAPSGLPGRALSMLVAAALLVLIEKRRQGDGVRTFRLRGV